MPSTIDKDQRNRIGDIVYQVMADVLNVPDGDKFQIITGHDANSLRIDPAYLGIDRSTKAFIIDITLNAGRSVELKQQFYAAVAQRLADRAGIRPQDVMIVLTEVSKENWSFGDGLAQYA